jgi:transcriptional regulator with XRE-family HTH domain
MTLRKKSIDKDAARQLRAQLNDAINRGELSIQEAVKRMRKISRLTQPEFANHRGVSVKVIKEIERGVGNPTVNTLNRIGRFFGLEVAFVRSERLRAVDGQTDSAIATREVAIPVTVFSHSPIEDSRRLVEELESIKRMVTPSKNLQETLRKMEMELSALRDVERHMTHKVTNEILSAPPTEMERAMKGLDTELRAVQNARNIIESAEKIQRQIQPPPELRKWLDDIDAAKKLLAPLDFEPASRHALSKKNQ